jgi:hypothetical protein
VPLLQRLTVAALVALAVAPGAVAQADWRPKPEPQEWQQLRAQYLPEPEWQFMDAIRNARVEAAEYIRTPRAVADTVELEAGLLLKTTGRDEWSSKVVPMRALCSGGRLERRASDGTWSAYPSRPDTAVKVRWMCSLR